MHHSINGIHTCHALLTMITHDISFRSCVVFSFTHLHMFGLNFKLNINTIIFAVLYETSAICTGRPSIHGACICTLRAFPSASNYY